MTDSNWSLRDAKRRLGALLRAASRGKPQVVTRRGVPAVVVLSAKQYDRMLAEDRAPSTGFAAHLLAIPRGGQRFGRIEADLRDLDR